MIDLRSDTVTRPSAGMRQAMATAEVGDDVFGDDPTVNDLQDRMADLLGKEAALFVPSGTMANQLALRAHTRPGQQVILEDGSHIYRYEGGAPAAFSGVTLSCVDAPDGQITWSQIQAAINPDDVHCAQAALICLENTHNMSGGRILNQPDVVRISEGAQSLNLRLHLDGARLWHVHVATGMSLAQLVAPVDSVSVCFSKALGAPVGSILAGPAEFIAQAHRYRKMFGGGMRQAGVLAAACLYALDHQLQRLEEDHQLAQSLVLGLDHNRLKVNHRVQTNIVVIDVAGTQGAELLLQHLRDNQILAVGFGPGRVRLVPNLHTTVADLDRVLATLNAFPGDLA